MKATLIMLAALAALWLWVHGGGLLLVVVGVAVIVLGGKVKTRTRTSGMAFPIHKSGHSESFVKRHENGHARVARALGCKAEVDLDEGVTWVTGRVTPTEAAAISLGGWAAAGSSGCGQDFRDVRDYLSDLPSSERAAARREAERIARRHA